MRCGCRYILFIYFISRKGCNMKVNNEMICNLMSMALYGTTLSYITMNVIYLLADYLVFAQYLSQILITKMLFNRNTNTKEHKCTNVIFIREDSILFQVSSLLMRNNLFVIPI